MATVNSRKRKKKGSTVYNLMGAPNNQLSRHTQTILAVFPPTWRIEVSVKRHIFIFYNYKRRGFC